MHEMGIYWHTAGMPQDDSSNNFRALIVGNIDVEKRQQGRSATDKQKMPNLTGKWILGRALGTVAEVIGRGI